MLWAVRGAELLQDLLLITECSDVAANVLEDVVGLLESHSIDLYVRLQPGDTIFDCLQLCT